MKSPATRSVRDQDTPADMVDRLLALIRNQFCDDMPDKKWFSMKNWFQAYVVLWPARQMKKKDFTLPAARYEAILRDVFMGVKRHGNTNAVRDWPGYLLKCVQDHWSHHWEEYYAEAKSTRLLAETALMACGQHSAPEDRTVENLAEVQRILVSGRRKAHKKNVRGPVQPDLFK